jgi:hypothetical protein
VADTRDWGLTNEISGLVWGADLPDERKVALVLEVYNQLPDYSLLSHLVTHQWHSLTLPARQMFWRAARGILALDDEVRAGPLTYSLWCDFFEDGRTCEEAWSQLVQDSAHRTLLQRMLLVSGPVPYPLKVKLYEGLVNDPTWHYHIFRSLLHSNFDYFGSIDRKRAAAMLRSLDLPPDTENLLDLQSALS